MTYEERIEYYVNRGFETRNMPLSELISSENLDTIELGTVNILTCNELTNAMVACLDVMILAREFYDFEQDKIVAEYAIYKQKDHDGHNVMNTLNINATYHFSYIGEERFDSVGAAIACAVSAVYREHEEKEDTDNG